MEEIKKVVIIGPESTGKSTLCNMLAQHYHTLWCQEYARDYLLKNGTQYHYDDLAKIARGQLALEQETERQVRMHAVGSADAGVTKQEANVTNARLLFVDTDMYVMKVWCEYVFSNCHLFILEEIVQRRYDMYLLCKPDIAWVKDELREYPDEATRVALYRIYKDILINQSVPWVEVSGTYEQRLHKGIQAVNSVLLRQS